ncbi:hypothetical protein [Nocardia panacis]|uniref:hypothetical protein n=1 Tax=Nocardia panacis TaxID=2340916 RepID=UPI00193ABCD3|nr:hypothetical protein [Nocardia panacis]
MSAVDQGAIGELGGARRRYRCDGAGGAGGRFRSGCGGGHVLHELDLAVRCCDRPVVLDHGKVVAAGEVLEVMTPRLLCTVFGVVATARRHSDGIIRLHYAAEPLA